MIDNCMFSKFSEFVKTFFQNIFLTLFLKKGGGERISSEVHTQTLGYNNYVS